MRTNLLPVSVVTVITFFVFVFVFNGISNFMGYLIPYQSSYGTRIAGGG